MKILESETAVSQALALATAAADLTGDARRLQVNLDDDYNDANFGATCANETQAVLDCHERTCPNVTMIEDSPFSYLFNGGRCYINDYPCDTSCEGIVDCGLVKSRAVIN